MELFYTPGTIAVAPALALQEAGLPHDLTRIDFASAEQTRPAYLALNPKGRVPALAAEGAVLTETGAILEYIAARSGTLLPADPLAAAQMRSVMYYLASTAHVNHAHKMRGARWAVRPESHADMAAKVPENMTAVAAFLDTHALANGPLLLGGTLTIGDCYLYAVCRWLPGDDVDVAAFPRITAFMEAMNARASVQALRDAGVIA